ncbi:MAG: family ATPase [Clostridiaceae bacterium]|jgi:uridine kinase|nr:family ATPase [Clostridiaceae bacterium]
MDDFYRTSNKRTVDGANDKEVASDFDIKRFSVQVINPITEGKKSKYQKYYWTKDDLSEWRTILPNGLIIVEGVYCTCGELYDKYDIRIFVECNRDLRLNRGLERWRKFYEPVETVDELRG